MLRIDILSFGYQFGIFSKWLVRFLFACHVLMQFLSLCYFCLLIQVLIFCIYCRSAWRPRLVCINVLGRMWYLLFFFLFLDFCDPVMALAVGGVD